MNENYVNITAQDFENIHESAILLEFSSLSGIYDSTPVKLDLIGLEYIQTTDKEKFYPIDGLYKNKPQSNENQKYLFPNVETADAFGERQHLISKIASIGKMIDGGHSILDKCTNTELQIAALALFKKI